MNKQYQPEEIEPKWRKIWQQTKLYAAADDSKQPKSYVLDFFPYPSGAGLSVGHVRNYTISDVPARFMRMQGLNVLHPMGWDAFGLPAENYAIKNKLSPRVATDQNKATYRRQMELMGFSYDWDREIDSTDPKYYRWTQWFFLLLFKRGLAYKAEASVWWCPQDKTVLANEQVITKDGKNVCERCGHEVEKRNLSQWFFKITDYADRLLKDLDGLNWPEGIKQQQRNWIGRSEGAKVKFKIDGSKDVIEVFTTRIDTLYGATFMVLAPEHPLVSQITPKAHQAKVRDYIKNSQTETEVERMNTDRTKTGVFTGAYAINPVNQAKLPIWIADYVLMGYGTGAIMAVPAHDDRDFEFAKKFKLPIKPVIDPAVTRSDALDYKEFKQKEKIVALVENDQGQLLSINWGPELGGRLFVGGTVEPGEKVEVTARREIAEETGYKQLELIEVGQETFHYKYYAHSKKTPTEAKTTFVHFKLTGNQPGKAKLENDEKGKFSVEWVDAQTARQEVNDPLHRYAFDKFIEGHSFTGYGILANSGQHTGLTSAEARVKITKDLGVEAELTVNYRMRDWLISRQRYWGAPIPMVYCQKCGIQPVPEDQLPVMLPEVKSYEPTGDGRSPLAGIKEFVETTCPKCDGPAERETDTMDGFACSSWYFLRFADPNNAKVPFDRSKADYWLPVDLYIGGAEHAVMHLLYARFWTKVMQDAGLIDFSEPFLELRNQGMILAQDGRKMSKSLGNVITPDEVVEQGYGADALRLYEMFIAPFDQAVAWNQRGIDGTYRLLKRVWTLVFDFTQARHPELDSGSKIPDQVRNDGLETALLAATHRTIKKVTDDIGAFGFNTAVAALMEFVNELYKIRVDLPFESAPEAWSLALKNLVQLLAPFAPFVTEELWEALGGQTSVHVSAWPKYEEKYLKEDLIEVPVQVNGRLRGTVVINPAIGEDELKKLAAELDNVKAHLDGKKVLKTIVVPRKLVNFVVK